MSTPQPRPAGSHRNDDGSRRVDVVVRHHGPDIGAARRVAVLVHGRGQDAEVMLDLARRLGRDDVAYLLPEAPPAPTGPGRSWYRGRFDERVDALEPELSRALASIAAAVASGAERSPDGAVVLVGFSQGACLVAEHVARRGRDRIAAAGILTGALIGARRTDDEVRRIAVPLRGLPVALVSSRTDAWVGPSFVEATARALADAGASVRIQLTDEPEHRIDDTAVAAVAALLDATQRS